MLKPEQVFATDDTDNYDTPGQKPTIDDYPEPQIVPHEDNFIEETPPPPPGTPAPDLPPISKPWTIIIPLTQEQIDKLIPDPKQPKN